MNPRKQPPVPVEDRPERPHRLSMTWLQFFQRCKHSALLHIRYGGGAASHQMDRGSVAHEVARRLTLDAIEHGERFDGEIAKSVLAEVFAEPRYTVDSGEWDWMRVCVFHFGEHVIIDPEEILGVEQLIVWDLGDWRVSMRLDLASISRDGKTISVEDYKTARAVPTQEEFDRSFQTVLYALGLAYGNPVTIRACEYCERSGNLGHGDSVQTICDRCGGKGYTETVEPHPLGQGAEFFHVRERYLGILWDRGTPTEHIAYRERSLTRPELLDEKLLVESLLAQVSGVFESGQWDAVPGDDQCSKCPCRAACPLPPELLPAAGSISSPEDAEHTAIASHFIELEKKDLDKAAKAWVKEHGPIPLGDGMELTFYPERKTSLDRDALASDIAEGTVKPYDEYVKVSHSGRFGKRPRSEEAAALGENGGEAPPPSETDLDAKYGETLPV